MIYCIESLGKSAKLSEKKKIKPEIKNVETTKSSEQEQAK